MNCHFNKNDCCVGKILHHIEHWQHITWHQRSWDRPSAGNVWNIPNVKTTLDLCMFDISTNCMMNVWWCLPYTHTERVHRRAWAKWRPKPKWWLNFFFLYKGAYHHFIYVGSLQI